MESTSCIHCSLSQALSHCPAGVPAMTWVSVHLTHLRCQHPTLSCVSSQTPALFCTRNDFGTKLFRKWKNAIIFSRVFLSTYNISVKPYWLERNSFPSWFKEDWEGGLWRLTDWLLLVLLHDFWKTLNLLTSQYSTEKMGIISWTSEDHCEN